ncbi:KR domain-containing protein [Streptomyces sp. NPDC048473]|uniref:KR domain-containing protein n=1 Tax=Streptomyces sp. NPDC048473 TaxID=3365556 RepID=UPI00371C8415
MGLEGRVSVAAVNGPGSLVVAGDGEAVGVVVGELEGMGRRTRRLRVSHAFHSPHMDGVLEEFARVVAGVSFRDPVIPVVSAGDVVSREYWVRHVREAVRFDVVLARLEELGVVSVLEVGPDAALAPHVTGMAGAAVMRRGRPQVVTLLKALAHVHVHGAEVDWGGFVPARSRVVDLPTYPFQRENYWLDNPAPVQADATRNDAEDVFWEDVERGDLADLAESLELGDEQSASLRAVLPALAAWRKQSQWRYGLRWQPLKHRGGTELSGTWLMLTPPDVETTAGSEPTTWALQVLRERGARVVQLPVDPADPGSAAILAKRISAVLTDELPLSGVLSFAALGAGITEHAAEPETALHQVLPEALIGAETDAPLWYVTRGAVSVGSADPLTRPGQARLWGTAKTSVTGSGRPCGVVDLPEVLDVRAGGAFSAVLTDPHGENQVAVRASGTFVRHLTRVSGAGTRPADGRIASGTVLVTGGDTLPGMEAARWLVRNGAARILLIAERPDGLPRFATELSALGAVVDTAHCDPADRKELAAALAAIPVESPLTTVVHAGAMHDGTWDAHRTSTRTAAETQVAAAVNLDELTRGADLETFVVFSSASGLFGIPGPGDDARVHAFLDALVHHRRGLGLPGTSVIWGRWSGDGESAVTSGHHAMRPRMAIRALGQALASGEATSVVADIDWERFVPEFSGRGPESLIAGVPEAEPFLAARSESPEPGPSALPGQLAGLSPSAQETLLLELIRKHAATVLGYPSADLVDTTADFLELGFSSFTALELRNRLCTVTGLTLTPMAVYDHPTLERLAGYLRTELVGEPAPGAEPRTDG